MNPVYRLADGAADMVALGASLHHVGCFCACLDAASAEPALNYAVPWVSPWSYEQVRLAVARLEELFTAAGRTLRIEFIAEAWPWLGSLLEEEGLRRQSSVELMVCTPETFRPVRADFVRRVDAADLAAVAGFASVENAVFPDDACEPELVRYQIEQGFWRCAVAAADGEAVAAGALAIAGRMAELAAMATLPDWRRRGLGAAIASHLVAAYFSAGGDLVWLALGSGAAASVYARVGFRPAGRRVSYSCPSSFQVLLEEIDDRTASIRESHGDWPCRKGCDSCCRSLARWPELTAPESALLAEGLAKLPFETQAEIRRRVAALGAEPMRPVVCPYLDPVEGACLVYDHRPVACRTYGYYRERENGLYCRIIEARVEAGEMEDVIWGNQESVDHWLKRAAAAR